jgi:hypothetical protein
MQHAESTYQLSRHVVNVLTPLWGMLLSSSTLYSVDSAKEYHVHLQHNLTIRVPIRKAIDLLGEHFQENQHCCTMACSVPS